MNRLAGPLGPVLDADFGDWQPLLERWRHSSEGQALIDALAERVVGGALVYPAAPFRALALTPLARTKVLILGQDPYHGPGQAEGLAFSVPTGVKPPPSLRNIFCELERDLGVLPPKHGHLGHWARQGVLLLNAVLTVEDSLPASHARRGWEALTDAVVDCIAADPAPKAFLLWGAHAQAKSGLILRHGLPHLVLQSNHPSPLSARRPPLPFIGCGHFSAANRFLADHSRTPVDWGLP